MKKLNLFFVSLLLGVSANFAQSPINSLDFDGTNDYATASVPTVLNNISSNDFTIETWIKPSSSAFSRVIFAQTSTSNFVALSTGNSNEIYFYINNNTSQKTNTTLSIGVWSHVACTWDASSSSIEIYINGVLQTTVAGGSSSTGNNNTMTIGSRTDGNQYFHGELDELRIWDIKRTGCSISAAMNSEFTTPQSNLVAYYKFNEGTAGGLNTGVTTLSDFTSSYDGTLLNFGLTGSSSNWLASGATINAVNQTGNTLYGTDTRTECSPFTWIDGNTYTSNNNTATYTISGGTTNGCDSIVTLDLTIASATTGTDTRTECSPFTWIDGNTYTSDNNSATYSIVGGAANGCDSIVTLDLTINDASTGTDTQTRCDSFTWIDGNVYNASNNTATHTIIGGAASGCDSIVTLDLTINSVSDVTTSLSGITITANNTNATYQWLDCDDNFSNIQGENGQTFTPTANGNYAVLLIENACVDTSDCVEISTVGVAKEELSNEFKVYPNPSKGDFVIDLGKKYNTVSIKITDLNGSHIQSEVFNDTDLLDLKIDEPKGVYLIYIETDKDHTVVRLVKE